MDKMDKYLNIPQEEQDADPCNEFKRYSHLTLPILPITSSAAHYGSALSCPYHASTLSTLLLSPAEWELSVYCCLLLVYLDLNPELACRVHPLVGGYRIPAVLPEDW